MQKIKRGKSPYHFVEVMACPSGKILKLLLFEIEFFLRLISVHHNFMRRGTLIRTFMGLRWSVSNARVIEIPRDAFATLVWLGVRRFPAAARNAVSTAKIELQISFHKGKCSRKKEVVTLRKCN